MWGPSLGDVQGGSHGGHWVFRVPGSNRRPTHLCMKTIKPGRIGRHLAEISDVNVTMRPISPVESQLKVTLLGVRHLARRLARQSAMGVWPGSRRWTFGPAVGAWPGDRRLSAHPRHLHWHQRFSIVDHSRRVPPYWQDCVNEQSPTVNMELFNFQTLFPLSPERAQGRARGGAGPPPLHPNLHRQA